VCRADGEYDEEGSEYGTDEGSEEEEGSQVLPLL